MNYAQFKQTVISNLVKLYPGNNGTFESKGKIVYRKHILTIISGSTQRDVINALLEEDGIPNDLFTKPQKYAHHLNSSQIVCYEFFRPMLDNKGEVQNRLKDLIKDKIDKNLTINNAIARFEYEPNMPLKEGSNFDFYIEDDNSTKIYFEIKYTESGFGKCKKDRKHINKYNRLYSVMMKKCQCLSKEPDIDDFCKHYQLFRNVLRVTNDKDFSVFIYPKENDTVENQFNAFYNEYIKGSSLESHVIGIHWEDLKAYMPKIKNTRNEVNFEGKFFAY